MNEQILKNIVEAAILAADTPLSVKKLLALFDETEEVGADELAASLVLLAEDYDGRGIELKLVSSGYRIQVRQNLSQWISKMHEEKPHKYSRAFLETLSLIAYRQPITRAGVEEVRGVSVSSNIIKSLLEREWVRVVGHRDVPGKPALYGTTKEFLDYFNLESLSNLPPLAEMRSIDSIQEEFDLKLSEGLQQGEAVASSAPSGEGVDVQEVDEEADDGMTVHAVVVDEAIVDEAIVDEESLEADDEMVSAVTSDVETDGVEAEYAQDDEQPADVIDVEASLESSEDVEDTAKKMEPVA